MFRRMMIALMLTVILLSALPLIGTAQGLPEVRVRLTRDSIVTSGPGENGMYLEYVANGREVIAAGRNADTSWIEINLDGQVVGWVPVSVVNPVDGDLSTLVVRGGLLDTDGNYAVDNPTLRHVQIELIRIQRPMRYIGARWFLLQDFYNASCDAIPEAPAPPAITDRQVGRFPELDRVRRELTFVQEQTTLAIAVYAQACETGSRISQAEFERGIRHLNNAYNAFDVVQKYLAEIVGLTFVVQ